MAGVQGAASSRELRKCPKTRPTNALIVALPTIPSKTRRYHGMRLEFMNSQNNAAARDCVWGWVLDMAAGSTPGPALTATDMPAFVMGCTLASSMHQIRTELIRMRVNRQARPAAGNFYIHDHPVAFAAAPDRESTVNPYSDVTRDNAHTIHQFVHDVQRVNISQMNSYWTTLCVTRQPDGTWHAWAMAAIPATKKPGEIYLFIYDSVPNPVAPARGAANQDYWKNWLRPEQIQIVQTVSTHVTISRLAVNQCQLLVVNEPEPLRMTMWWMWNIAIYGPNPHERDHNMFCKWQDDPRGRLTDCFWLPFNAERLRHFAADVETKVKRALARLKNK
ncbi:hypothetical protein BO71DRAFT_463489 [Aspergillus ellipticus CBS 707.79]|uniref:Uncharacterized protein n=1 Tax=Aspergillus ellipticus CBS 707.79 TaxID=1448320 RepID=A0A319DKG2_9EURO|nr:hypothetical protein BO71DRAFT_463489 [Aspergillus ellipticus CBS 707.79]